MYDFSSKSGLLNVGPHSQKLHILRLSKRKSLSTLIVIFFFTQRPLTARTMSDIEVPEKAVPQSNASSVESTGPNGHGIPSSQSHADGALQMLEAGSLRSIDPEKSKRLLRRIDIYIMPLICMYVNPPGSGHLC
jgi:hypothetical protein